MTRNAHMAWAAFKRRLDPTYLIASDGWISVEMMLDMGANRLNDAEILKPYLDWFDQHGDWFSDPLDVEFLSNTLSNYILKRDRTVVLTTIRIYLKNVDPTMLSNWYARYTMFDPTMGMYEPDEASAYFNQRMMKRFNLLALMIEEGP